MKLLVTGGAGFIGSNFIDYMLRTRDDVEIVNFDKLTYAGNLANTAEWEGDDRYTFIKGDICDVEAVNAIVPNVDVIVHFAAETHVDRSVLSASEFVMTNVVGTQVLLDAALKNDKKRFHHISTDEVFGHLEMGDDAFTEETIYDPRSPYSASKAASDHMVRAYYHTHGLPVTISNCTNNYGPKLHPEKFIPLAITNILEGKKVPVYGKGDQVRDWLYVEDHCRAIELILEKGEMGETYGVGGNNQPTNFEIVTKLADLLGKNVDDVVEFVEDRPGHDFRYDIDYSKIQNELGWEPSVTLEEGLEKTVTWYTENEQWWRDVKSGAYEEYYAQNYGDRS